MSKEAKRNIKTAQIQTRMISLRSEAASSGKGFKEENIVSATDRITIAAHEFITGDRVQMTSPTAVTPFIFVDGDVTVVGDNIAEVGHGLVTGERVILTTTGVLPAGLALATSYYAIVVDADNFKLAASDVLAIAGTAVDITAAAGGGNHTVTSQVPTALALATDYWVIKNSVNEIQLATSLANAKAGTDIGLTIGEGGLTFVLTLTEVLTGLDRYRKHVIQVQSTGVYRIVFDPSNPFASADDVHAYVEEQLTDQKAFVSAITATYVEVTMNDMDTPAVENGFFDIMIIGSESGTRW